MAAHNPILEARLESIRQSLDALGAATESNLNAILAGLDSDSTEPLESVAILARQTRERCLLLVARNQPLASDLTYAMGALRVGHDYERLHELCEALNKRVERLRETPLFATVREMSGVLEKVLELHSAVSKTWQRDRDDLTLPDLGPQVLRIGTEVQTGLAEIQRKTVATISSGMGSPEMLVDLVLVCRHIKRITALMAAIPEELHSFDRRATT